MRDSSFLAKRGGGGIRKCLKVIAQPFVDPAQNVWKATSSKKRTLCCISITLVLKYRPPNGQSEPFSTYRKANTDHCMWKRPYRGARLYTARMYSTTPPPQHVQTVHENKGFLLNMECFFFFYKHGLPGTQIYCILRHKNVPNSVFPKVHFLPRLG